MMRCRWADPRSDLYVAYHDHEWGQPEHDDRKLFEMLILEGFQAGLSWLTILNKREAFRTAFDYFEPVVVAQYGPEKVEALMEDTGIVRNRRKILAAIQNAKVFLSIQEEFGFFDSYLWGFTGGQVILNTDDTPHLQGPEAPGHEFRGHDHYLFVSPGNGRGQRPRAGLLLSSGELVNPPKQ